MNERMVKKMQEITPIKPEKKGFGRQKWAIQSR
jgi:hypothetical protein